MRDDIRTQLESAAADSGCLCIGCGAKIDPPLSDTEKALLRQRASGLKSYCDKCTAPRKTTEELEAEAAELAAAAPPPPPPKRPRSPKITAEQLAAAEAARLAELAAATGEGD